MTLLIPLAGLGIAFGSGVLLGWRWGREDGRRELAARIDSLARRARNAPR